MPEKIEDDYNQAQPPPQKLLTFAKDVLKSSSKYTVKRTRKTKGDESLIKEFYKRPDISRCVPQKRFANKDGAGYLMQISISNAWAIFTSENGKIVSLGRFAALRPRNVRKLSDKHREYCVCVYCTNVRFKLIALSKKKKKALKKTKAHESQLMDMLLCEKPSSQLLHNANCINGDCQKCSDYLPTLNNYYSDIPEETVLTWSRWENRVRNDGKIRKECITKSGTKEDLLVEMVNSDIKRPSQGFTFLQHLHTANWQTGKYEHLKKQLPEGWILQVMDFAKNREVTYQDEIKSVYYTQNQITMHPIVTFFNFPDGVVRESSIIISEDNTHDFHAVNHYQEVVNQHLMAKIKDPIERRVIFSDGCAAQYKSKGPFADIALEPNFIDRNFFGSDHGKSDCDAEIGVINKSLDMAILGRRVIINNATDMFDFCQEKLIKDEPLSKRNFFLVKNGEIQRQRPQTDVKPLKNSRKCHQILNTNSMTLKTRNLSCFCREDNLCVNATYVDRYKNQMLVSKKPQAATKTGLPITSQVKNTSEPPRKFNSREDFFKSNLRSLEMASTFDDLREKCIPLSTELDFNIEYMYKCMHYKDTCSSSS